MNPQPCSDHARIYEDFVRDIRNDNRYPFIKYTDDYNGESVVKLCPSQHQSVTPYRQKKLTEGFIDFLLRDSYPIVEMQVCTIASQRVFEAICNQRHLESLRLKCFSGKDISHIVNLSRLKKLFIESGLGIEDISYLADMAQLEVLILGETKKIYDYSCLGKLKNLKVLGVCHYQTNIGGAKLKMKSNKFINEMPNLEWVDLVDCKIE